MVTSIVPCVRVRRAAAAVGWVAVVFATLCGLAGPVSAQLLQFFGDERVGASGGQFLRIPVGARGVAMGSGMTSTIEGAAAVFWNPAAMSTIPGRDRLFVSHTEYVADIDVDHVAYVHRIGPWQIGLSGGMLRSGEIVRTSEFHPSGTGATFEANQFLAGLSIGRLMTDRFSFAGGIKLLQENLDEYENRGAFLDFGALYFLGFKRARVGFAVRNFGKDLKLNGSPPAESGITGGWQSLPAPTVADFGFAYDVGTAGQHEWTVSLDFSHPSDQAEAVVLGSELSLRDRLFLRGGYRTSDDGGTLSLGFGLTLLEGNRTTRFDYAFDDRGAFGSLHIFSLELGR